MVVDPNGSQTVVSAWAPDAVVRSAASETSEVSSAPSIPLALWAWCREGRMRILWGGMGDGGICGSAPIDGDWERSHSAVRHGH
ncbi:hypothetical protein GCM10010276_38780 [Streptomyces longisporus]|uniref:Uncharacterized protein n=1 Tax=Streptomyces longisporus TaxID=1948 RepID=A0ABP5ZAG9_STRLO